MLEIKTTGFEDYLDGSANIRTMVIGGPGAGKTRWSSFWPKPFFIDCEDGRGSIADRGVPYVRVRTSQDMLDTLQYLKGLESVPKAQRKHQTVVVDTADSFQRIVKEEWVTANKAGAFTGFDAWGYLDTKMQLLFTRLLNLDYNVIVLVHYKTKEHKDGDNTVREFVLQLQGQVADQVFNDFGLVGWMGTYWEAGQDGRVQKRGLTFQPTPDKPFLKDRFHVTPPWMEVTFADNDYDQLFSAFMNRADIEAIPEASVVEAVPSAVPNVAAPREGGPVGGLAAKRDEAPAIPLAAIPLEKQTKEQLVETGKQYHLTFRGNALKSEMVTAIQAARAAATGTAPPAPEATTTTPDKGEPAEPVTDPTPAPAPAPDNDPWTPPSTTAIPIPETSSGSPSGERPPTSAAEPQEAAPQPAESASADQQAIALVASQLGGEVISEEKADTPTTPQPAPPSTPASAPSAPAGPSACADCGADLTAAWADPAKKNAMRMGFIKHRRYLCTDCNEKN